MHADEPLTISASRLRSSRDCVEEAPPLRVLLLRSYGARRCILDSSDSPSFVRLDLAGRFLSLINPVNLRLGDK